MRKQDEAEYVAFVQTAWGRLFRSAYALTGDYQQAEDALQSALVKAYASWPRVRGADRPEAYVRRMLVNQVRSSWRRASWRIERSTNLLHHSPVESHETRLLLEDQVWRALMSLPPRQRAVVVLRYFDDLSEQEIADVLGVRPGTVKSQAAAALAALRRTFQKTEKADERVRELESR